MLILDNSSIAPSPRSIPASGDDVTVSFRFRTNTPGTFSTLYTVTNAAYQLANATGGGGKQLQIGPRQAPGVSGFADVLQVGAAGAASDDANLVISLQIQEQGQQPQTGMAVVFLLHKAVSAFRAANSLSQAEMASQVGVSRSTISRVEQGGTPSDETRAAIEKKLVAEMPQDAPA